jgi:hypothetical protein
MNMFGVDLAKKLCVKSMGSEAKGFITIGCIILMYLAAHSGSSSKVGIEGWFSTANLDLCPPHDQAQ